MAERLGTYNEGALGLWSVTCADCPLLPHTRALGQKPPECAGGMATNMQGPIVLKRCSHLGRAGDAGFRTEDEQLFVDCTQGAPAA